MENEKKWKMIILSNILTLFEIVIIFFMGCYLYENYLNESCLLIAYFAVFGVLIVVEQIILFINIFKDPHDK